MFKTPREKAYDKPLRLIAGRINRRFARKYIGKYPQLAVYSFDHIGQCINTDGRYEKDVLQAVVKFLDHKGINLSGSMLDIGANIGNHSVFFSEFFQHVYAFEPNPYVFALLQLNARGRNIEPHEFGLSDKDAVLEFHQDQLNLGGSHIVTGSREKGSSQSIKIEVKSLDQLEKFKTLDVSLIKIDVEGHEAEALKGAKCLIRRCRPAVLFELDARDVRDGSGDSIEVLRELGYSFYTSRKNFHLGNGRLAKLLSLMLRIAFGESYQFSLTDGFQKRNYDIVVALPETDND